MPEYMDVHRGMEGITPELLKEAHDADLAIQDDEKVNFKHAWADPASGMAFCLSDAPDAYAVKRIDERVGQRTAEVSRCRSRPRAHGLPSRRVPSLLPRGRLGLDRETGGHDGDDAHRGR